MIIHVSTSNASAPGYMKLLTDLNEDVDHNTIILRNLSIELTLVGR